MLNLFNMAVTFATAILLAQFLGVQEYGLYSYALSWATLLGIFAKFGIDQIVVRNIAVYHQQKDWGRIRGMLQFSILLVILASLLCALVTAGAAWLLHHDGSSARTVLWLVCLLLPLQALVAPFGATQQGLGQITLAQIPSLLVTPGVFLTLVLGAYALTPTARSAYSTIVLQAVALAISLVVAGALLRTGLSRAGRPALLPKPIYQQRSWLASAVPLILMGSMFMINSNADILMLGSIVGPAAAGTYKVATRGADLLIFSLTVISVPLGPLVARLYAAGEMVRLQRELKRWALLAFFPSAFLALIFIIKGHWFLALFGAEFVNPETKIVLSILTVAQLILVAAGPVGLLFVMSGHERFAAQSLTAGAVLNVVLNAVLIPIWGVRGAAMATAVSTTLFTFLLISFSIRRLQLNPTIFPFRL